VIELVNQPLELKRRVLSIKQRSLNNFRVGVVGETRACDYLEKQNYQILSKNVRFKNKEVDIVALDTKFDEIVFIEVKTRISKLFGEPDLAVDRKKLGNMETVAKKYLKNQKLKKDYRFDIISISGKLQNKKFEWDSEIEHFENITWP
jgi:putative endonuclease